MVRAGVRWVRPLANGAGKALADVGKPRHIVIAQAGDDDGSTRVGELIGARRGPAAPGDMLIGVATRASANGELAAEIGDHRRVGGAAAVVVVGTPAERRLIERELASDRDVGIAVLVMADGLSGDELVGLRERLAARVVREWTGLRWGSPAIGPDLTRHLQRRAAFRAAVRALMDTDMHSQSEGMKVAQVRMVFDTAAVADRRPDPVVMGLVAAIGLLPPIWRRAGRLTPFVPFTRTVIRGSVAYSITRLIGIVAKRLVASSREHHQEQR
jgi:hypothetical protein